MSNLQYGNGYNAGQQISDANEFSMYVKLPNGIIKLSGQGGWDEDFNLDADDYKLQIDNAFDNVERVLKAAGLNGWQDVYLVRSYQTDIKNHFPYLVEVMKKRIPHRQVWTALSVPALALPEMSIEIEVEAFQH